MDAIRIARVEGVQIYKGGRSGNGALHLTAHHLIFTYDGGSLIISESPQEMWVPYPLINLVTRPPQTLQGLSPISFRTRTFEAFTLSFSKYSEAADVFDSVKELTLTASVTQLYAFLYTPETPVSEGGRKGWEIYHVQREFMRMGVGTRTKAWRFSDLNKDYNFSSTYPAKLVVPSRISDATLTYAGKYRSKARIPALTYLHWNNYGTITRCSQPMVGITQNRSIQDEKLVEAIFQSHLSVDSPYTVISDSRTKTRPGPGGVYGAASTNLIIDARPTTNAVANVGKGGGTENMDNYKEGKKAYLGVDHIHTMRDSLSRVVDALKEGDAAMESLDGVIPGAGVRVIDRQALRRSGWLRHISALLEGTILTVRNVHVNSSHVLVHCSDGWDRTSQVCALAEICLDPYYRTIVGFQVLIEKDWLSFGHKFLDRCGHLSSDRFFQGGGDSNSGSGNNNESEATQAFLTSVQNRFQMNPAHIKEMSPVFHQFLECVRQIQRQFPSRFEFNERFLERIHYHLYSCQFGTFLFNCERERRVSLDGASVVSGIEKTQSVWEWFNSDENKNKWINEAYDKSLDNPKKGDMGVLFPNSKDVRFWHELYGRTDEEMNGRVVLAGQAMGAEVSIVEDSKGDELLAAAADTLALQPSSSPPTPRAHTPSTAETLARRSPNLPTKPKTTPSPSLPAPAPARPALPSPVESFRPYSASGSNFSLRPSGSNPGSSPHAQQRRHSAVADTAAAGGFAGLATGGVKSMWGMLSTNASAAFSVVQDVAATRFSGATASGNDGELREARGTGGGSAPPWNEWAASSGPPPPPATMHTSTRIQASLPSESNPWAVPTPASPTSTARPRRIEDEWQAVTAPASSARSQTLVAAPVPRHAPASSLLPAAAAIPLPASRSSSVQPGKEASSDPLGAGLL